MTPRRTRALAGPLALLVAAAGLLAAPAPAAAQSAADVAVAREIFIEGSEFAKQGRWEEARERYERSLAIKRAPITLYSLGVAQQQTGQLVEALESFRAFLVEPSAPATKEYEKLARQAVQELERHVAGLDLRFSPEGVAGVVVKIDGVEVPAAALDRPRPVNPGNHVVTVSAPGYREARRSVAAAPGSRVVVMLTLERDAPSPGASTPGASAGPRAPSAIALPGGALPGGAPPRAAPDAATVRVLPIALLAGGLTTVAAGVAIGLLGVASASDAPTRDGDAADAARAQALAGDIVAGAGLLAAGAGVLVLVLDRDPAGAPRNQAPPRAAVGPLRLTVRF
ncbi:PEGA domain-containing protein [Sorangium sp. So ce861]|uniref:PEGA domain-containing protein n=1 Tax=Sorangium sp. So ce861 TaxID=3133323 RepID=UPI003F5E4723